MAVDLLARFGCWITVDDAFAHELVDLTVAKTGPAAENLARVLASSAPRPAQLAGRSRKLGHNAGESDVPEVVVRHIDQHLARPEMLTCEDVGDREHPSR